MNAGNQNKNQLFPTHGQHIFDKGGKNIQWRKDSLFNKWCWKNWTATCKRMNLDHYRTPYTKISSKYIKDLNVILETMKFRGENIGSNHIDVGLSDVILDLTPKAKETKAKINK